MPNKSIFAVVAKNYEHPDVPCPKCDSPMVARQGKNGWFWGCSTYPKCKGTLDVEKVPFCPKCGAKLIRTVGIGVVIKVTCSSCDFTQKPREKKSSWHYPDDDLDNMYDFGDWGDQ